jgi:hypothetical protein
MFNTAFFIDIHFLSTAIMVGVIWVIQLIHYPSFHFIKKSKYSKFQQFHMNRISIIVIPTMIIEIISGLLIFWSVFHSNIFFISSLFILISIWGITFIFFTKMHQGLVFGYNQEIVNKLILINWSRTLLWSLRLIILCYIRI